ncbi:hypothetical protein HK105_201966 [Polyrhizophydium stewartii]|uniref:N-acetyltransferase domain-containing protein n=1 Tax=Polyrhizophydium stewartii TaxID=2732419 RepID=A0ABR4NGB0_9FUNG
MFNLDAWMDRYFDPKRPPPQPMPFSAELQTRVCMPDGVWRELTLPGMSAAQVLDKFAQVRDVRVLPYARSVLRRIQGDPALRSTLTVLEPRTSPYTGKRLQPYILRDYAAQPPKKAILETIASRGRGLPVARAPVDLVYFHEMHLQQANDLLSRTFWPGIDVSENLLCPDFSVVALYKRLVVGCAFMTPGGYITFIAVAPGWERCGIASRMLFHLVRKAQAVAQDVTLHVSANNRAMLLYQKFGFKPEGFIVGFYDQYLPEDSPQCKNAVDILSRSHNFSTTCSTFGMLVSEAVHSRLVSPGVLLAVRAFFATYTLAETVWHLFDSGSNFFRFFTLLSWLGIMLYMVYPKTKLPRALAVIINYLFATTQSLSFVVVIIFWALLRNIITEAVDTGDRFLKTSPHITNIIMTQVELWLTNQAYPLSNVLVTIATLVLYTIMTWLANYVLGVAFPYPFFKDLLDIRRTPASAVLWFLGFAFAFLVLSLIIWGEAKLRDRFVPVKDEDEVVEITDVTLEKGTA